MKYYVDTEFLEGTQKENFPISLFRKNTPPTIDLISIGIVSEDGREYYAISKDFNLKEAWNRFDLKPNIEKGGMEKVYWIRENVLKPIYYEMINKDIGFHDYDIFFKYKAMRNLIAKKGKTNKQIAEEIIEFTEPTNRYYSLEGEKRFTHGSVAVGNPFKEEDIKKNNLIYHYPASNPKFYAYFADYDWVAFCWLFGNMMDLPTGFPMYCKDLKQILDEKENIQLNNYRHLGNNAPSLKNHVDYPKQQNEHNALADARWNKQLHEFLNSI